MSPPVPPARCMWAPSLIVRTLKGVKRPALATCMPAQKAAFLLLDCGANVECRPEMLERLWYHGQLLCEKVMGRRTPPWRW